MASELPTWFIVFLVLGVVALGLLALFQSNALADERESISKFFKGAEEQAAGIKQVIKEESGDGELVDMHKGNGEFLVWFYITAVKRALRAQSDCVVEIDREIIKDIGDADEFVIEQLDTGQRSSLIKGYHETDEQKIYGGETLGIEPCICESNICNPRTSLQIEGDFSENTNSLVPNPILYKADSNHVCLVDANLADDYIGKGDLSKVKNKCGATYLYNGVIDEEIQNYDSWNVIQMILQNAEEKSLANFLNSLVDVGNGRSLKMMEVIAFSRFDESRKDEVADIATNVLNGRYGVDENSGISTCWKMQIQYSPEEAIDINNLGLGPAYMYNQVSRAELNVAGGEIHVVLYLLTGNIPLGTVPDYCTYATESS